MEGEGETRPAEVKADVQKMVEKWLHRYADGLDYDRQVVSKLSDLTLNYIYYLVGESDQIAALKGAGNITGGHVRVAIETVETRVNLVKDEETEQALDLLKVLRTHAVNTDESLLTSRC